MIAAGFIAQGAQRFTSRRARPALRGNREGIDADMRRMIALPIEFPRSRAANAGRRLIKREPKLDILVNNAGAAWGAAFDEFPENGWDKVMDLNVKSLFFLTKALAKPLRAAAATNGRPR